jgi:sugar lactone lactonase YvrE
MNGSVVASARQLAGVVAIALLTFGINGPISNPVTNYIRIRLARLELSRRSEVPIAIEPREVNVGVIRLDPAIDAIVPPNPKIYKLAEGFERAEAAVWMLEGRLLLRDAGAGRVYEYIPDGRLAAGDRRWGEKDSHNVLYVTNADPERPVWMRYELRDGRLLNGRVFFDATAWTAANSGSADGLKVDRNGNLFAAGPGGIFVLAPNGSLLGRIHLGAATSNCNWGEDGSVL